MRRVTSGSFPLVEPRKQAGPGNFITADYLNSRFYDFKRRLAYPDTSNPLEWEQWRAELKRELTKLVTLDRLGQPPTPVYEVLTKEETDDYTRFKIAYQSFPDCWVPAYLLVPGGGPQRRPAVICPHGHIPSAKESVIKPGHEFGVAYGHEFAKNGLVVLAPDNAGMYGERDFPRPDKFKSGDDCEPVWFRLNHMGIDITGFRVFELMTGLKLLQARGDVDSKRLGCAGLSGGCWLSLILSALDDRISAAVLSGFFTTFPQTIWNGSHCICQHPFGIGLVCDIPDIAALVAPRPIFVESGVHDDQFPVEPAYSLARRAYELVGSPENIAIDRFDGGHKFNGEKSVPWMVKRLSQAST